MGVTSAEVMDGLPNTCDVRRRNCGARQAWTDPGVPELIDDERSLGQMLAGMMALKGEDVGVGVGSRSRLLGGRRKRGGALGQTALVDAFIGVTVGCDCGDGIGNAGASWRVLVLAAVGVGSRLPGPRKLGLSGALGQIVRCHAVDALLGVQRGLDLGEGSGEGAGKNGNGLLGLRRAFSGSCRAVAGAAVASGQDVREGDERSLGQMLAGVMMFKGDASAVGVGSRLEVPSGAGGKRLTGASGQTASCHAVDAFIGVQSGLDVGDGAG